MFPTLQGIDNEHPEGYYGFVDKDKNTLRNIKRFQIVTTYYPGDVKGQSDTKIKRVIFMPGETFKVINSDLFVLKDNNWTNLADFENNHKLPFERRFNNETSKLNHNYPQTTLKENEYFVSGDNWDNSWDSFDPGVGPVTFDMLDGLVIKMEGLAKVKDKNIYDAKPFPTGPKYYYGVNY